MNNFKHQDEVLAAIFGRGTEPRYMVDTAELISCAQLAAADENFPELAQCLGNLSGCALTTNEQFIAAVPLARSLGKYDKYFGDRRTGPEEALSFLQMAAERLMNVSGHRVAIEGWDEVIKFLIPIRPDLAMEKIDDALSSSSLDLRRKAFEGVESASEKYSEMFGVCPTYYLTRMSNSCFVRKDTEFATGLAALWRKGMNVDLRKEDKYLWAISRAVDHGGSIINGSPMEREWAEFILTNHRETLRRDRECALETLACMDIYCDPHGPYSAKARKAVQACHISDGQPPRPSKKGGAQKWVNSYECE